MAASGVSQVTQVRSPKTYEAILAEYKNSDRTTITAIIHNGASVHWLKRYADLEATNIGATAQLLQLAVKNSSLGSSLYKYKSEPGSQLI
ncbi:hypothetical protein E4U57_005250 [Claviceps arundinis]|uniref:Thioester reductase (TE) domain-containing protein n=1 Tax=Claviceps arundinis TaxID=1623583 RepID=A0ABQ7P3P1_9HYPO|nr:hypothetical protein E4U57_005250 [Claviceps arundinis]